ncbi:MAG TPA: DUF1559 domain-containing protein [Chthonomonadales bacterium]|nr:DUF1559 domain-containing protein [Chthonomonadales bacterium]
MSRKTAFTLIELLVVIAIIAILAAILFPVFAKARETARGASCLSNFKQIMLGIKMYTQDYDETKPPLFVYNDDTAGNSRVEERWHLRGLVMPYIKNRQIWICPSLSGLASATWFGHPIAGMLDDGIHDVKANYKPNMYAGYTAVSCVWAPAKPGCNRFPGSQPEAALQWPSTIIGIVEGGRGVPYVYFPLEFPGIFTPRPANCQWPGYFKYFYFNPHNSRGNFAFEDGHVKSLRWIQTYGPTGSGWETFMWFPNHGPAETATGGGMWPEYDQATLDYFRSQAFNCAVDDF